MTFELSIANYLVTLCRCCSLQSASFFFLFFLVTQKVPVPL